MLRQSPSSKQRMLAVTALIGALVSSPLSAAEEAEDENQGLSFEAKLAACAACHGEDGNTPVLPQYPLLGGQYESYLVYSLQAYRAGRRVDAIMSPQIQVLDLTDKDIQRMAEFYADQGGLLQIDQ